MKTIKITIKSLCNKIEFREAICDHERTSIHVSTEGQHYGATKPMQTQKGRIEQMLIEKNHIKRISSKSFYILCGSVIKSCESATLSFLHFFAKTKEILSRSSAGRF